MLDRLVTQIEPPLEHLEELKARAFHDFLDCHNIILLGDPGSGKTHIFERAAQREGAVYKTVRDFVYFDGEDCAGQTIYLDALDESRSRSSDKDTIKEIVRVVRSLDRPKIRLSCRAADWLGNTDQSIFRELARDNGLVVLRLEPLTEAQILRIAQDRYSGDVQHFYKEAMERGLEALVTNPQTLIMLLGVVADGVWPRTRQDLYERSVKLLLTEPNEKHAREALGKFEATELLDAAGAASASILISGVPGLSLRENSLDANYPSYRHVPFDNLQKVQAALCRRAFIWIDNERVTYVHRTVAEFLAAKWLAARIQKGLPLGRVQSLIGVEGVPTPELRGLHAWLATLSPEHAPVLIAADPYGVLVYGDAASLPPRLRKALLEALQRLAQVDPWFRAGDWTDKPLGGLSGPDMVEAFRSVLADSASGFHLRSVVLDAIENGPEIPELHEDLIAILADSNCPDRERRGALDALLHIIPGGVTDVVRVYRDHFVGDRSTAQLRAQILVELYPAYLTTADIVAVFDDILNDTEKYSSSDLWRLTDAIPDQHLPEVVSALSALNEDESFQGQRHGKFEVESAFRHLLERFFASHLPKQPGEIWRWLSAYYRFTSRAGSSSQEAIQKWLLNNPSLVLSMFDIAVEQASISEIKGFFLSNFLRTVLGGISSYTLAKHILDVLDTRAEYSERDCELYQFAHRLCFSCNQEVTDLFEQLYALGDRDNTLAEKRDAFCVGQIEEWRYEDAQRKLKYTQERLERHERDQQNLYATAEWIRTGQHLHNLGILAQRYFGVFADSERIPDPVTRLRNEIGDELTQHAIAGFQAVLLCSDLPSPKHIAELRTNGRYYSWWYAILAGMDEKWCQTKGLEALPHTALETALCLAFELDTSEHDGNVSRPIHREWPDRILTERPELARRAFHDFLCPFFEKRWSYIRGLDKLVNNEKTLPWRGELALGLLEKFSSAPPEPLRDLLAAALSVESCREKLAVLAKKVLTAQGRIRGEQRTLWMATAYLLSPRDFSGALGDYLRGREEAFWTLKEFVGRVTNRKETGSLTLTIEQRRFFTALIGRRFENAYRPVGGVIEGNRHGWDAAEFVRWQIEALSAEASQEAGEALVALAGGKKLASYGDHLRHAIANQAKVRRQQQYEQPDWDRVIETLWGGKPANIADLHALAIDHLKTLRVEVRHSNVDTYKQFWRLSARGNMEGAQHEEFCRDRLIEILRPRLVPLRLSAEPEGHMAADKRTDIALYYGVDLKLPIEIKRHAHTDLWTACENQLQRLYTRDPHAAGFGIYLVFWFGEELGGRMPSPPRGGIRPDNAEALEEALRLLIPRDKTHCLDVIVLDVTPPADTKKLPRHRKRVPRKEA
jgi:hypothetical protein